MANDLIWIWNVKTGKRRPIRRHLWDLWWKDKDGNTRGGGWAEVPESMGDKAEEFTSQIQQKIVDAAPVVQKKSPVANAVPAENSAMDMQMAFNEAELNKVETPAEIEVAPVTDEPQETEIPEESDLVEVEDKAPVKKRSPRKKR